MATSHSVRKAVPVDRVSGAADASDLGDLYRLLGHEFRRPELLEEALTHPSASTGEGRNRCDYQRLEFVGDRVLDLVIAHLVYQRYRSDREGELARRHTALVRGETLARVAAALSLGKFMRFSKAEDAAGGRENPTILADCCEAVIAALFLDGGMMAAVRFIYKCWVPLLNDVVTPPKDAKTELQEWAQGRGLELPSYRTLQVQGPDHQPTFSVQVTVKGHKPAVGNGLSKRAAEMAAAKGLLQTVTKGGDG